MASTSTLPRRPAGDGASAEFDDLDDLFNYDVGDENDPFSDNYSAQNKKDTASKSENKSGKTGAGLGIDEEVEVSKKIRAPNVKLDEHRLLSAAGIPKLRRKAKDLKFKGKGHEYSDAARLLAFYQLWLDDLFPKARFLDALAMVEKVGHKRQMQMMRTEWINEGKPRQPRPDNESLSIFDPLYVPPEDYDRVRDAPVIAPIFQQRTSDRLKTPVFDDSTEIEMDGLYDATPKQTTKSAQSQNMVPEERRNESELAGRLIPDDEPPEDDLDALLAEEEMMQGATSKLNARVTVNNQARHEDTFDDDMEAMAELEGLW